MKDARDKEHLIYRGARIRITEHFLPETMKARREWNKIFKVLKRKKLST